MSSLGEGSAESLTTAGRAARMEKAKPGGRCDEETRESRVPQSARESQWPTG
jgi:hypothetical protein